MATLSEEQKIQYRDLILNAIAPLAQTNDGWIKSINLGPVIKQAGIDYKCIGFMKLKIFLLDIFGSQLELRGEKLTLEIKFPTSIKPNDDSLIEKSHRTMRSNNSNNKETSIAPYQVRNLYRKMLNDPSAQAGWVKVKDLMEGVGWDGSVTNFAKTFGLKIKAPNLVRISNISRFEILDDIYFDPKRNPYPQNIEKLRSMALDEPWEDNSRRNGLLENYLCYTYARVKEERKIALSEDGLCGCWNTGLVDMRYLPIYCYMIRKNPQERWMFQGFCIDGEDLGKVMASQITNPPSRAEYFTNRNLLFEADSTKLSVDYDHIITEHPSRLPEDWVKRALGNASERVMEELPSQYDERVGHLISEDREALTYLQTVLGRAIDISLMRCQWNYKTAIPYYDPNSKGIGWFLPLCIRSKEKLAPFAALVVTKQNSGRYQGQTIYKLSWAYRCARLVCRPDSDWLSPSCTDGSEDE